MRARGRGPGRGECEDEDEHEHWRSGILTRWVGPWGDSCRDFSRHSTGPACQACQGSMAAWRHGGFGGVAGLSLSEMLKIRRLSPTRYRFSASL